MPDDSLASEGYRQEPSRADFWNPPSVSFADRMEQSNVCAFDLSHLAAEEQLHPLEAGLPSQRSKLWSRTWEEAMRSLGQENEPMPVVFQTVPICYERELNCSRQGYQVGFCSGTFLLMRS